jgi:hypothetical protein
MTGRGSSFFAVADARSSRLAMGREAKREGFASAGRLLPLSAFADPVPE